MLIPFVFVAAAALTTQLGSAAPDPRGEDAVTVFDDLCVSLFTGEQNPEIDPSRFAITQISEQIAHEIKPDVQGPLWDVSGTKTDARMLVHYEPAGLCVVEVAEADEASVRARFERLVQQTSTTLGSIAQREPDQRNHIDGQDATTSMWRVKSAKGNVMLSVTTYPDPKFMIQHLMTASYVE